MTADKGADNAEEIAVAWGGLPRGMDGRALLDGAARFSAELGLTVQLLDAAAAAGEDHLRSAALHALRARRRNTMRTASLGMETLLYASGRRQIRQALETAGVGPATTKVAAVLVGAGASRQAGHLMAALGLRPLTERGAAGGERAALRLGLPVAMVRKDRRKDLALEAVALLDIER